jgi:hypothetical protein
MTDEISYEPPTRRGMTSRLLPVAVVIGGLAMGAAGVAVAQDATNPPTPNATPSARASEVPEAKADKAPGLGRKGGHREKGGRAGFGMPGALHGEFTVERSEGVYTTIASQRGTVTAVSATSISVQSEDGFTRTYVVTADTLVNSTRGGIDDVETGEKVAVMATVDGETATAVRIHDVAAAAEFRQRMHPRQAPGAPAPAEPDVEGSSLDG